ncbi:MULTISPECIES: PA4642 family protein [unclassified Pseudomonas]|uniref:PA4642 family protein n=1 Tax=unclassified Pseudomonas TaxID=196821 RepID=UPI000BCC34F3|nr:MULTISPECIES: PA4642 family protein [unclassified Pseudomonas]PVZ15956.1 hypothetical protein F474_01458 [Pseudomonas sp. URIL14HWK12:I12]PVZ26188.1 hypothetical protein F470_01652 [Pseudomonas sp. URIL14HWK12:I10]PVZ36288.1 hypothetical protein F472_01458 [Pseudomonas sp. URIL14HWK12:I11]SNZ18329.1 hypothetical protein SAMN05660463_03922 [Pseudomonas sp. URIL14HWK12:I9]
MRKDKKQIIGDEISDDYIKTFLQFEPADDTPAALHKLIKAYRGLRVDDFERFVKFFKEQGLDVGAQDANGKDFVAHIQDQRNAPEYIAIIEAARQA